MNKVMNALNEVREKCLNGEQISGLKISRKHRAGVPNMMKYLCELGYVQKIKSGKYRWKVGEVIPVMAKAVYDLAKSKRTNVTTLDQMDEVLVKQLDAVGTVLPHKTDEANAEFKRRYIDPMFEVDYERLQEENSELKRRVEELELELKSCAYIKEKYMVWCSESESKLKEKEEKILNLKNDISIISEANEYLKSQNLVKYTKFCIFGITVFKIERR